MKVPILFLFFCFFSGLVFAQKSNSDSYITYIDKYDRSYYKYEYLKALEYAKKANQLAVRANNSKQIANSYQKLATTCLRLGLFNESLIYANMALDQDYIRSDLKMQLDLQEIVGLVYSNLNLKDQAIKSFTEILNTIPKETRDVDLKKRRAATYFYIGTSFDYEPEYVDSIEKYMRISTGIYEECPQKDVYEDLYFSYLAMGGNYLELKNDKDSAKFYLQKAYDIMQKYDPGYLMIDYNILQGRYYFLAKNYKIALIYYMMAVNELEKLPHDKDNNISVVYKNISEIYDILGDYTKSKEYLEKFSQVSIRILEKNKKSTEYALKHILNIENKKKNTKIRNYIFILVLIVLALSVVALNYYFKEKKKNHKVYRKTQDVLNEKENIIILQEKEAIELKQKANTSFNEILELAKENNPHFLKRFQEVYPEFYNKILKINPNLKPSEISLSAYISLGFSNKEIAEYTFKSIRTIESNRYNLRKKLNLSTEIDFFVWLNSMKDL
ncbi:tetratricopeptide repeat protein [Chryseobacterium elymi]|nr:LuxR C-terminal-related transcriptional regulator [Chryseobacterium elymi]